MKSTITFLVGVLGLALLGAAQVVAPTPTAPRTGKVLLLDNEKTLEGDIELVGSQYRVRRTIGETYIPATRVLTLAPSLEEAFRFLQRRSNLRDADERIKLADWARQHGLRDFALTEVRAAVALRPDHPPTQRLLQILNESGSTRQPTTSIGTEPEMPMPTLDLSAEAMTQFTTKVQPILMNACAHCHATGKGGGFKLTRTFEPTSVSRRTLVSNAAAVLAQINLDQPRSSALLSKAVSSHGDMTLAPFQSRQAAAFRTLEEWVQLAAVGHVREPGTAPMPMPLPTSGEGFASGRTPEVPLASPEIRAVPTMPTPTAPTAPLKPPATSDPFDPEGFNRQAPRP